MKCKHCGSEWQSKIEVNTCPFCGKSLEEPMAFTKIERTLRFIMDTYGEQVNRNPNSMIAYLSDLAPQLANERRLLKMCADAGIIAELLSVTDQTKRGLAAKRAVAVLSGTYFLDANWAETAVGWLTVSMGWTNSVNGGTPVSRKQPVSVQAKTSESQRTVSTSQTQEERIRKRREELKQYKGRIVCGSGHILALHSNGTVIAYGSNYYNQCGVQDWRNVTAIACSSYASFGLSADRTVLGTNLSSFLYPNKTIEQIAACGSHLVCLCADKTVVADTADMSYYKSWRNVTAIASSLGAIYGLRADGTVVACGDNDDGECNVESWKEITSVDAANGTVYGIRRDGRVYAQGRNDCGQCNVRNWQHIIDIATGDDMAFGLGSDGRVVCTGFYKKEFKNVRKWTDVVALAYGIFSVAGLKADGTVVARGVYDRYDTSGWRDIVAISCGNGYIVGLQTDGTVVFTGKAKNGEDQIAGRNLFR